MSPCYQHVYIEVFHFLRKTLYCAYANNKQNKNHFRHCKRHTSLAGMDEKHCNFGCYLLAEEEIEVHITAPFSTIY